MNVENIKRVRDHIAALPPERFDMQAYFGERAGDVLHWIVVERGVTNRLAAEGSCNSCACIAGHALAVLAPDDAVPGDPAGAAAKLLGLSRAVAGRLFEPNNHDAWFQRQPLFLEDVSRAAAVAALDHLAETGRVNWSRPIKAHPRNLAGSAEGVAPQVPGESPREAS